MQRLAVLVALVGVLAVLGCTPEDEPGATASVTPTGGATATVGVIETPTASPTATATATVEPAVFSAWLINLADGDVHTIYEHPYVLPNVWWVGPRAVFVDRAGSPGVYDEDGRAISFPIPRCRLTDEGFEVGGVLAPQVTECGPVSPDFRFMLFERREDPEDYSPVTELWVLDVETGETRLLDPEWHGCGGCDSRFGPQWSPDGRFVIAAETFQDGEVVLVDLETGVVTVLAHGSEIQYRPSWSPDTEVARFLMHDDDGATVLVNAETNERTELPIGWPATFDTSGDFAYSFPWGIPGVEERTTIIDLGTMEFADIAGVPPWSFFWWGDPAVAAREPAGVVATVVEDSCLGTVLFVSGVRPECLEGALGAVPSPDGRQVAFSRTLPGPGRRLGGGAALRPYEIVVMDVESGVERVVATGAYSGPVPPRLQWSRFGDLLLVTWPAYAGI